jgi:hypothetical protein
MRRTALRFSVVALICVALALWVLTDRPPLSRPSCPRLAWAAEGFVKPEEGDNSRCLCCHMYLDGEEIVEKHLKQKLTCRSCHGPSEPHRQDETLRTKPDYLWGRAEVTAMCGQCHGPHKNPAAVEQFRQQWLNKARPNGRFIRADAVCTDCHGEHTAPPKK